MSTFWILGCPDAEMTAIESLLRECGQQVFMATAPMRRRDPETGQMVAVLDEHGAPRWQRVSPGQVAAGASELLPSGAEGAVLHNASELGEDVIAIEVAGPWGPPAIDHHDEHPLASAPPSEFLRASSLGQVIGRLAVIGALPASWTRETAITSLRRGEMGHVGHGRWIVSLGGTGETVSSCPGEEYDVIEIVEIPSTLVFESAADHCPAAAVAGLCPGVDPGAFAPFLAESKRRQYFPAMSAEDFARELEISRATLRMAPPCVALDTLVPTQIQGPDAEWFDAGMQPAGYVRDLRHLEPGTVPAQGSGECYPQEFLVGIVAAIFEGLGFVCRIRRRDGRLALRSNGHGQGTLAGTRPAEVFLADPAAFGCGPRFPPGQDASYGNPIRGFFGGLLIDQG